MPLEITPLQLEALGRRPLRERVAEELANVYPPVLGLGPARIELIAADAIDVAKAKAFAQLDSVLWFALTMLKVHPRFHTVGSIGRALDPARPGSERDRIAAAVDDGADDDWERAGRLGGFDGYYADLFRRG